MIRRGRRSVPGAALKPEIVRVFAGTFGVYGTRKVRRPMTREGVDAAGCTVERLRRDPDLKGVIGGKPVRTAVSDKATPWPKRSTGSTRPWRSFEAVECDTLEWVDRFNDRRLPQPIGNIPATEAEQRYYAMLDKPAMAT